LDPAGARWELGRAKVAPLLPPRSLRNFFRAFAAPEKAHWPISHGHSSKLFRLRRPNSIGISFLRKSQLRPIGRILCCVLRF
jgi:hypothetical protein